MKTLPKALVTVLPALTLALGASAQGLFEQAVAGDFDEPDAREARSDATFEINGTLRGVLYAGRTLAAAGARFHRKDDAETKTAYGEAALLLRARNGTAGDAFGELRFRRGDFGDATEVVTDLREAYVNAYVGPLDVRLGEQIIVWGRADGINPTNNLTPQDRRVRSP